MSQEESEHNEVDGMKKGVDSTGEVLSLAQVVLKICSIVCQKLRSHVT